MKEKIGFDYKFIFIFLIVIFKYFKMQKTISDLMINLILCIFAFLVLIIFFKRQKIKNLNVKWVVISIIAIIVQICFLGDIDLAIIILLVMAFSEDKNSVDKILKYYLISMIIVFLGTLVLDKLGLVEYKTISRVMEGNVIVQRNSLGFIHPNQTYVYFFFIMLLVYYFMEDRFKFTIVMIISTGIIYHYTLSRTGLVCSVLFLMLVWFYNGKLKLNKYLFLLGTIFTFFLAFTFGSPQNEINELLSNRPYIYNIYISNNLWCNIIGNNLVEGLTLDNAFLNIIVGSGWIIYFYYFAIYWSSAKYIQKNKKLTIIFIVIMIYGCIETHIINIGLNFMLVIQVYSLICKKNKLKEININEEN